MKIALIGDLQYRPGEEAEIAAHLAEVAAQSPDLAVFMGDMGCHGKLGTREGMAECKALLDALPCPVAAILGNHDVEYRPDENVICEPEEWYRELFGREVPWQAMERDGVFLLCLSVERQPEQGFLTQHALYVSDEQFSWAQAQLAAHRDWPTILFTHAPVVGSGLRCFPPIHSAATDAYLDAHWSVHLDDPARFDRLSGYRPPCRAPMDDLVGAPLSEIQYKTRTAREGEYVRV